MADAGERQLTEGCSSATAVAPLNICGTARLFAIVPIQRLITGMLSQLLEVGIKV